MEAQELRQMTLDELKTRVQGWRDELFRAKFKTQSSEARDTSVLRKLRRDIARALTILSQKTAGTAAPSPAVMPVAEDKPPVKASAKPASKKAPKAAAKKSKSKTATKAKRKGSK
jgi:large subunit ribosomal protein L29